MAHFILVAGAFHGGWCWERVVPLLQAAGHSAEAPDLIGMGEDPTPTAEATLDRWAEQIAALVEARPHPVILVGHSRGGTVISSVAERAPDRIVTLVYVAAMLLPSGQSLAGGSGGLPRLPEGMFVPLPDGTGRLRPEGIPERFYNTSEPEWAARACAKMGPEPVAIMATPLVLTHERFGQVPRAYIECTEDRTIPLSVQRGMQAALPCDPVFTMTCDHSPHYSDPVGLAGHLLSLA
jgi:pimeloyl-ACP methyl ester carboxylesterase